MFCAFTFTANSQVLTDRFLHYKSNEYWDSILYLSYYSYYHENNKGIITEKSYPVITSTILKIVKDSPLVSKEISVRDGYSKYPYKYVLKNNNIYIQYYSNNTKRIEQHKEYSINSNDTVKNLIEKSSLESPSGISVSGYSIYLGEKEIQLNGKLFNTYHFIEDHKSFSSHTYHYKKEVFLEKKSLIPIKIVVIHYDFKSEEKTLYYTVTELAFSSKKLIDYKHKKSQDLILYENKNTCWTEKQKKAFMNQFSENEKKYGECMLVQMDGKIPFFRYEKNPLFFSLFATKKICK